MGVFTGVLSKVLGGQLLRDLGTFVAALETMFGGFRERAERTYHLLQQPGTAFVVVAAPERDALREAAYFADRLAEESMPLAGLVLNRVHGTLRPGPRPRALGRRGRAAGGATATGRRPACCGCTPSGSPSRTASAGCATLHLPSHRAVAMVEAGRSRPTCTTSTGCARWRTGDLGGAAREAGLPRLRCARRPRRRWPS